MFEFLGGRHRKRQIGDARRKDSEKEQHLHNRQSSRPETMATRSSAVQVEGDHLLDNSSVDMSLYTTPSKGTFQYHRGVHNLHNWQSRDSSMTLNVASAQSRLGGWEAPPTVLEETFLRRTSQIQENKSIRSGNLFSSHVTGGSTAGDSLTLLASERSLSMTSGFVDSSFQQTKSVQSSAQSQGPIDVDSLEFVEDDARNFTDLLSTFEAQSLAGRMAPNTAATHHERNKLSMIGSTLGMGRQASMSKYSSDSIDALSRDEKVKKAGSTAVGVAREATMKHHSDNESERSSREGWRIAPFPSSPNGSKWSYRNKTVGSPLDLDDSRSLATDVSGLTMLTMEQSVGRHPSYSAGANSRHRRNQSSSVIETPSVISLPEDVSFSGLFSRCEAEGMAERMFPISRTAKMPSQSKAKEPPTHNLKVAMNDSDEREDRMRLSQREVGACASDSIGIPDRSQLTSVEAGHRSVVATIIDQVASVDSKSHVVKADRLTSSSKPSCNLKTKGEKSAKHEAYATCSDSELMEFLAKSESSDKSCLKKEKAISKKGRKETTRIETKSKTIAVDPAAESSLDEISFSGLFSTLEAESLAGRLDTTSRLGNLEGERFWWDRENQITFDSGETVSSSKLDGSINSMSQKANADDVGSISKSPSEHSVASGTSSRKRTTKRSNVTSKDSLSVDESLPAPDLSSVESGNPTTFSKILSVFEARSSEPPAMKRLLPGGAFPINVHETISVQDGPQMTAHLEFLSVEEIDVCSTLTDERQEKMTFAPHASVSNRQEATTPLSPRIIDDSSSHFHVSFSIDHDSTILPPPLLDDDSWSAESWAPPTNAPMQSSSDVFSSVVEMDGMSILSFTEEVEADPVDQNFGRTCATLVGGTCGSASGGVKPDLVPMDMELRSPRSAANETSLQYAKSMESSLQKLESTASALVVKDISSLLDSVGGQRSSSKQQHQHGPVDLDDFSVADSNSEISSLYGSARRLEADNETPCKSAPIEKFASVASPLTHDDEEDEHQFVDDEEEATDNEKEDSYRSNRNLSQFDEAMLERSYKETMESLSLGRHESGSLLLTEHELSKHLKSTQFKESLPSSCLKGYDTWKKKQLAKQRYFNQIHKEAMKRKEERERLLERRQPSLSHHPRTSSRNIDVRIPDDPRSTNLSMMERSISSTIQTSQASVPIPRKKKKLETRAGWNFLRREVLHRRDGNTVSISDKSSIRQKRKTKNRQEPSVISLEQFMRSSSDEPDDISLVPMNQLGFDIFTLTSSFPAGGTESATQSHNLDHPGIGPRLLALQHLELERARNRQAEKEKTKLENLEQQRIAMLKERELERQRRLNFPRGEKSAAVVFTSKLKAPTQYDTFDQFLERNLSFETTNTAPSSINSPSSVLSPCILCNAVERSHVAQPCMHFYFCEACAKELSSSATPVCPVCTTKNVSFSRVYT